MSVNSRLRNCEKSLKGRERALLWLKTSQAKGGYLEYGKLASSSLGFLKTTRPACFTTWHLRLTARCLWQLTDGALSRTGLACLEFS
jgi:hypothetical protein